MLAGAEELISTITAQRSVHRLILGHNELGDDGCIALFTFLGSSDGRKYRIAYISLNANDIGERGFLAIADYVKDNQHLKQLLLQNVRLVSPQAPPSDRVYRTNLLVPRRPSSLLLRQSIPHNSSAYLCR